MISLWERNTIKYNIRLKDDCNEWSDECSHWVTWTVNLNSENGETNRSNGLIYASVSLTVTMWLCHWTSVCMYFSCKINKAIWFDYAKVGEREGKGKGCKVKNFCLKKFVNMKKNKMHIENNLSLRLLFKCANEAYLLKVTVEYTFTLFLFSEWLWVSLALFTIRKSFNSPVDGIRKRIDNERRLMTDIVVCA